MESKKECWSMCPACKGYGKKSRRLTKKVKRQFEQQMLLAPGAEGADLKRPQAALSSCSNCSGSGLIASDEFPQINPNYPHVAIIGGGIGGTALAVACLHRGIPFTLYERDKDFHSRSQGYGLTLQQASKAMEGFGIFGLQDGVISTRHLVHTTQGRVVGEWGVRKWLPEHAQTLPKRSNIHIARQSLRFALLQQLGKQQSIQWGHQLLTFKKKETNKIQLTFEVDGDIKSSTADLLVGADGIRSVVRNQFLAQEHTPLNYLGCLVILGICPLDRLSDLHSPLLDSATVFQTANGNERIYVMPYKADSVMWQLSFPLSESEAKALSSKGPQALQEEAARRTHWHDPIPQIIAQTQTSEISGYPVYDRELLDNQFFTNAGAVTLIGDAAHPMSPFKGQGANQALLDALALARAIGKGCLSPYWRENGIRNSILTAFESDMLARSAVKVRDSADAAVFLHSEIVLHEGDEPRGRCRKKN